MNATTDEPNQISVLQFGNQDDFILELFNPLSRFIWQPFNGNFLAIGQSSLQKWTHVAPLRSGNIS